MTGANLIRDFNLTSSQSSTGSTAKNYRTRPLIPPATQASSLQLLLTKFGSCLLMSILYCTFLSYTLKSFITLKRTKLGFFFAFLKVLFLKIQLNSVFITILCYEENNHASSTALGNEMLLEYTYSVKLSNLFRSLSRVVQVYSPITR